MHGDVKAQNIMREEGGRIVLMDFNAGQEFIENQERKNARVLYLMGCIEHKRQRYDEAVGHLERCAKLAPDEVDVQTLLGTALSDVGRYKPAIRAYDKALALRPGWEGALGGKSLQMGNLSIYRVRLRSGKMVQATLPNPDRNTEQFTWDEEVFLTWKPIIAPALVSGWLLAFTLSIDDLMIASFVSGPGSSTLPMVIFFKVKLGVSPDVNALATIIIGIVATGIILAALAMRRQETKRAKDVQMAVAANE